MTILEQPFDNCSLVEWIQGGSKRKFARVECDNETYILMQGKKEEVKKYANLAGILKDKGINVPDIYQVENDTVLMEDLGELSLYRYVKRYGFNFEIYESVIKELVKLQNVKISDLPVFCYNKLWNEYKQFKEFYVPYAGIDTQGWECKIEDVIEECLSAVFVPMHRDFQSTNIYIKDNRIYLIDFQDMHSGPFYFDLASLLFDPYVMLQSGYIWELVDYYSRISEFEFIRDKFLSCGILRIMQALGAFVRLSQEGKDFFRDFIKGGRCRLRGLLRDKGLDDLADAL